MFQFHITHHYVVSSTSIRLLLFENNAFCKIPPWLPVRSWLLGATTIMIADLASDPWTDAAHGGAVLPTDSDIDDQQHDSDHVASNSSDAFIPEEPSNELGVLPERPDEVPPATREDAQLRNLGRWFNSHHVAHSGDRMPVVGACTTECRHSKQWTSAYVLRSGFERFRGGSHAATVDNANERNRAYAKAVLFACILSHQLRAIEGLLRRIFASPIMWPFLIFSEGFDEVLLLVLLGTQYGGRLKEWIIERWDRLVAAGRMTDLERQRRRKFMKSSGKGHIHILSHRCRMRWGSNAHDAEDLLIPLFALRRANASCIGKGLQAGMPALDDNAIALLCDHVGEVYEAVQAALDAMWPTGELQENKFQSFDRVRAFAAFLAELHSSGRVFGAAWKSDPPDGASEWQQKQGKRKRGLREYGCNEAKQMATILINITEEIRDAFCQYMTWADGRESRPARDKPLLLQMLSEDSPQKVLMVQAARLLDNDSDLYVTLRAHTMAQDGEEAQQKFWSRYARMGLGMTIHLMATAFARISCVYAQAQEQTFTVVNHKSDDYDAKLLDARRVHAIPPCCGSPFQQCCCAASRTPEGLARGPVNEALTQAAPDVHLTIMDRERHHSQSKYTANPSERATRSLHVVRTEALLQEVSLNHVSKGGCATAAP